MQLPFPAHVVQVPFGQDHELVEHLELRALDEPFSVCPHPLETVVQLMKNTTTRTGLAATVNILEGIYETGRKASEDFKAAMPTLFDTLLGKWNYRAIPQQ